MHARGVPVLGTCLGAQLIAQALGGSAERMPTGEVGWVQPSSTRPPGRCPSRGRPARARRARVAQLLVHASGRAQRCSPTARPAVQAFRVGATSWGLQFHVEVTLPVLEEWAEGGAAELAALGLGPETILGSEEQRAAQLRLATRIADRFARAVLAAVDPRLEPLTHAPAHAAGGGPGPSRPPRAAGRSPRPRRRRLPHPPSRRPRRGASTSVRSRSTARRQARTALATAARRSSALASRTAAGPALQGHCTSETGTIGKSAGTPERARSGLQGHWTSADGTRREVAGRSGRRLRDSPGMRSAAASAAAGDEIASRATSTRPATQTTRNAVIVISCSLWVGAVIAEQRALWRRPAHRERLLTGSPRRHPSFARQAVTQRNRSRFPSRSCPRACAARPRRGGRRSSARDTSRRAAISLLRRPSTTSASTSSSRAVRLAGLRRAMR